MNKPTNSQIRKPTDEAMKAEKTCKVCGTSGFMVFPQPRDLYAAVCLECYDGAPDAGPQDIGYGTTEEAAIDDFIENQEG